MIDRSATFGVTSWLSWSSSSAVLLLGVESLSNWSRAVSSAVFVFRPIVAVVAVIVSVALAPLLIVPTVQMPVPLT